MYKPTDKMGDLICENYALLQVMSRFGISLGFGDKSVQEVCDMNQVDCNTFLIVVNFLGEESNHIHDHLQGLSIPALVEYLKKAHSYFLDFQLPTIRRKLIEAIDCSSENEVAFLIVGGGFLLVAVVSVIVLYRKRLRDREQWRMQNAITSLLPYLIC